MDKHIPYLRQPCAAEQFTQHAIDNMTQYYTCRLDTPTSKSKCRCLSDTLLKFLPIEVHPRICKLYCKIQLACPTVKVGAAR